MEAYRGQAEAYGGVQRSHGDIIWSIRRNMEAYGGASSQHRLLGTSLGRHPGLDGALCPYSLSTTYVRIRSYEKVCFYMDPRRQDPGVVEPRRQDSGEVGGAARRAP